MAEHWLNLWKPFIEVSLLWFIVYMLLLFIRGTRTVQVLKGLIILLLMFFVTQWLDLTSINWILTKLVAISVIAFLIIFQPELRRGLARLGQFGFFVHEEEVLDDVLKSAMFLSNRKIGGIIALEREIGLRPYVESGIVIDSQLSSELVNTIFTPGTPLHDGGVIVSGNRIVAAGCLFPLTQNPHVSKTLGTRHRAAIGLTEETDAVCVVVSEETGGISISVGGKLTKNLNRETLPKTLENIIKPKGQRKIHHGPFRIFGGRKS